MRRNKGWVKNRFDGSVELVAEGPREKVDQLVQWCHHRPPAALVTRVHETEEDFTGESGSFRVIL